MTYPPRPALVGLHPSIWPLASALVAFLFALDVALGFAWSDMAIAIPVGTTFGLLIAGSAWRCDACGARFAWWGRRHYRFVGVSLSGAHWISSRRCRRHRHP